MRAWAQIIKILYILPLIRSLRIPSLTNMNSITLFWIRLRNTRSKMIHSMQFCLSISAFPVQLISWAGNISSFYFIKTSVSFFSEAPPQASSKFQKACSISCQVVLQESIRKYYFECFESIHFYEARGLALRSTQFSRLLRHAREYVGTILSKPGHHTGSICTVAQNKNETLLFISIQIIVETWNLYQSLWNIAYFNLMLNFSRGSDYMGGLYLTLIFFNENHPNFSTKS